LCSSLAGGVRHYCKYKGDILMIKRNVLITLIIILIISGCSSTKTNIIELKSFKKDDIGIEFKYPEKWVVTDISMGLGLMWLVIAEKKYDIFEGNQWPFLNIYGFKPNDMSIITKRLKLLKEINKGKETKKSETKINGKNFIKYKSDEINEENRKGKVVDYVLDDKNLSILIETFEINNGEKDSFTDEINGIINSIKFQ
jgi:hypothetical protein